MTTPSIELDKPAPASELVGVGCAVGAGVPAVGVAVCDPFPPPPLLPQPEAINAKNTEPKTKPRHDLPVKLTFDKAALLLEFAVLPQSHNFPSKMDSCRKR
jgi:hypothetical protein